MKCEKCGKRIKSKNGICECVINEKNQVIDEDLLIYDLLEGADLESTKKVEPKESIVIKKNRNRDKVTALWLISIKVILSLNILLFLTLLFIPWHNLGGAVTYEGFVQIPRFIATEEFEVLDPTEYETYEGDIVTLSPVRLMGYVLRHFGEYQVSLDKQGNEKLSVLSTAHMVVIMFFVVVIVIDILAIILLLGFEKLKVIRFVKIGAILNIIVVGLNYGFMKFTYINMFALRAMNQMKMVDSINAAKMTSKGIAVNRDFYPYTMSSNTVFQYAIILLASWLFISAVLTEVKRKWDYENRDLEISKE